MLPLEDKALDILNAAETMFAEKGYHETTVSDIVKLAGVAQGTLYLYFANKAAVFEALVDRFIGLIEQALEEVGPPQLPKTVEEALEVTSRLYERTLLVMWEHQELTRLLITEMRGMDDETGNKLAQFLTKVFLSIDERLTVGHKQGIYRTLPDHKLAAFVMFAPIEYIFTTRYIQARDEISILARNLADILFFGIAGRRVS